MIRITLKAPLLAKNARNGGTLRFCSGQVGHPPSQSGEARTGQFPRTMALGVVTASTSWTKPGRCGSIKAGARFLSSPCRLIKTRVQTFAVPALRKLREERGTPAWSDANEIKGWATSRCYNPENLKGIEILEGAHECCWLRPLP
jgi:hypothetical protein